MHSNRIQSLPHVWRMFPIGFHSRHCISRGERVPASGVEGPHITSSFFCWEEWRSGLHPCPRAMLKLLKSAHAFAIPLKSKSRGVALPSCTVRTVCSGQTRNSDGMTRGVRILLSRYHSCGWTPPTTWLTMDMLYAEKNG